MTDEIVEAAFRRASAAIDEAWQLVREHNRVHRGLRVETLSNSLAQPLEHQLEITLSKARTVIETDGDRQALAAVARAAQVQDLISETALLRLLKDYGL